MSLGRATLARKGETGALRLAKRPGVRPSPVYSPEDLGRVKKAQVPQVVVMPPPGGGRWCSRTRSPRGASFIPSIARIWCGRAAEGQALSHRQRGCSLRRASRSHDPAIAQDRQAPRRQSGRVEDSPCGNPSPINPIVQYRGATPNPLKARPGPGCCKTTPLCNRVLVDSLPPVAVPPFTVSPQARPGAVQGAKRG